MRQLSKIDVILHKVGINTKKYKEYCIELQYDIDFDYYAKYIKEPLYRMCQYTLNGITDYNDINNLFPLEMVWAVRDKRMSIAAARAYIVEEYLK